MLDAGSAAQIAEIYQLGDEPVLTGPVARGEVGQVWRLTTSHGDFAVKEPFEPLSVAEADDDAAYQDAVIATGVLMPAVVRTRSGAVVAEVGHAPVRVYGWVDLGERDARLDPATVGRLVASIHRVRFIGHNPVDPWYTDPIGADRWDDLVQQLAVADAPFAAQLAEQRDELVALENLLEHPADLQTCHRDLFADNVLRTPAGALCVIDWENSGLADPTQELGLVLFEYSCGEAGRARDLHRAYRDAGGPGCIERPGNFSMVIAQLAHIGEISCSRWLDPARLAEQDRNTGRVDEFVTQMLTRSMIDELVDAVSG
ncbi:MAG: aminoglycoside phosphotransferase family protein [Ilumatobacteraceae bacterium]